MGGTALLSINKAAHRVIEGGIDEPKLGRWCWTKLRGRSNHVLKIFVGYCPNPPTGPNSVYAQCRAFFLLSSQERCPRKAFVEDMCKEIQLALAAHEKVMVLMDGNHNMKNSHLKKGLKALILNEAILTSHETNDPSTHRRNSTRTPIDGRWVSPGVTIQKGGYLDYNQFIRNANHMCLWIDVTFTNAFGHNMPAIIRPSMRCLTCHNSRIINNYITSYEYLAAKHNLLGRSLSLLSTASYPYTPSLQHAYKRLDNTRCEITRAAEKKCRKLRTDQVTFSLEIQLAHRTIKAWTLLKKQANGCKTSSRLLSRMLQKAGIDRQAGHLP